MDVYHYTTGEEEIREDEREKDKQQRQVQNSKFIAGLLRILPTCEAPQQKTPRKTEVPETKNQKGREETSGVTYPTKAPLSTGNKTRRNETFPNRSLKDRTENLRKNELIRRLFDG